MPVPPSTRITLLGVHSPEREPAVFALARKINAAVVYRREAERTASGAPGKDQPVVRPRAAGDRHRPQVSVSVCVRIGRPKYNGARLPGFRDLSSRQPPTLKKCFPFSSYTLELRYGPPGELHTSLPTTNTPVVLLPAVMLSGP